MCESEERIIEKLVIFKEILQALALKFLHFFPQNKSQHSFVR